MSQLMPQSMPQQAIEQDRDATKLRINAQRRLGFIDMFIVRTGALPAATGEEDATVLSPNQIFAMGHPNAYKVQEKSRQIGTSWAFAADSVANAVLFPDTVSVHISTDQNESNLKANYCYRILESLPKKIRDNINISGESKSQIEITHSRGHVSTINFIACRDPRGSERATIYLHELAFMPDIEIILKGAIGCTSHGGGINGCSTHQGAMSLFKRMVDNTADEETGERPYDHWARGYFPWWVCPQFCVNIAEATMYAPQMDTAERVEKYGNEKIKRLFAAYSLDDFREEFECIVLDERHSFFSEALIKSVCAKTANYWFEQVVIEGSQVASEDEAIAVIRRLGNQIKSGYLTGEWIWAMDLGRHNHPSEICIGHILREDRKTIALRAMISMKEMPFPRQQKVIHALLRGLPITRGYIDNGGMGMQLAEENAAQYGQRVMSFQFTNESKSILANGMKKRMERNMVILPLFSPLMRQFQQIKQTFLKTKHAIYDVEKNSKSHGDKFWSVALLCALDDIKEGMPMFSPMVLENRMSRVNSLPNHGRGCGGGASGLYLPPGLSQFRK